jgi:hypothetical protein
MIKQKKKGNLIFTVCLLAYALLFLAATAFGMRYLWNLLDHYERSRPHIALDGYMTTLSKDYVLSHCYDLIDSIDHNIQTEQQCRDTILEALEGSFSCGKKVKESDENTHVYALRCGRQVIGTMTMTRTGQQLGDFTAWEVVSEEFDLSYLVQDAISITVPEDLTVYSLGNKLSSSYITESDIPYPILADLYDDYDLPTMVTYTAGPFLGEGQLEVKDEAGNAIDITPETDLNAFANNCDDAQTAAAKAAAESFILRYVDFTSCTGNDTMGNYNRLKEHMVPGGALAKRMYEAIVGLYWVTDRHATVTGLEFHNYLDLGDGRYLCLLTYTVDTTDFAGSIQAVSNVMLFLKQTDAGLKAESMISYE